MTHGSSYKALLLQLPIVIDTSLHLWDDLARIPQCVNGEDQRGSRWQQKQSLGRRAKSHSPSRRSRKLRHTNGRLNEDPSRDDNKQQPLACLQPTLAIPIHALQQEKERPEALIPKRSDIRRSITCASHGKTQLECATPGMISLTSTSTSPTRLKICYRDEALRARSAENTRRMIVNARQKLSGNGSDVSSPTSLELAAVNGFSEQATPRISSNQQKLALKALKYRNLLARTNGIDDDRLRDPSFDVLECLGVKWCKV